jgi:mercuric ion transport protein
MNEWSSPFLWRTLLRTLSALLTICLLAQFFVAGVAAMTDPGWWTYHSDWVAIFQWLVIPLPILAWLGGPPRGRRTLFACIPLLQIALQYVLAHRAIEGRLAIDLGLHALDAGPLLLIAAGLAVGLFD